MNCCNDYGQCKQGHGCPARATPLITRQGLAQVPPDGCCHDLPEPTRLTERQDEPLGVWEGIAVYGGILVGFACTAVVVVTAVSYFWHR